MVEQKKTISNFSVESDQLSKFADSYESFNRIINSLQRKYIELKDEFSHQNEELTVTNSKLMDLSDKNMVATEFLNSILNSISIGVIAVDQNGRITHFNPAASIILGIPIKEPLGKHYRDIIPPGNPIYANALRTAESSRSVDSVEKKTELEDGTMLNLNVSTSLLKDSRGVTQGAVEVFQDLTKIKKMEQEIARLNTLAALGEMAATIAHEVRNPLSGISGFAALLEQDLDEKDPRRKLVKKIIRGVTNLNNTVTSLLNYTKLDEINKTNVNFKSYLNETIKQFYQENQNKALGLKFDVSTNKIKENEQVPVSLDKLLFRQVFYNIFTNAAEVCGKDGEISISYQKMSRQTAVQKYSKRLLFGVDETVLEITISDNGSGISMENLDKVFAPFFTTKQDGNGLGLAISWKIVKAHSGEIFAESSSKKGTVFTILLPVKINCD